MEFEKWCEENGFEADKLSEPQRKKLTAAWKADVAAGGSGGGGGNAPGPSPRPTQTMEQVIEAGRREEKRVQDITELVASCITEQPAMIDTAEALGRQAIEGKWPLDRFELELLRARRPSGGAYIPTRTTPDVTDAVIEAAVCKSAGLARWEELYDQRTLEAADRHYPHGMSLCDLIMSYARRGGYTGHSVKANVQMALRAAARATDIHAAGSWGPSTQGASIGSLLANVANKFLRIAFEAVDAAWREIAATRSANDFKQITTWSLTGDLTFKKLPPGGEIEHGQVDGTSYTNQVDTFARMLGLDRRDIVNDDIGAFTSIARRMGRGGAIALNKLFWGIFLNNSAVFTSGRGNLITGAGTTLQLSQLDVLNQKFLTQTDPDGNVLAVAPRILLVPPALKVTAQTLMSSTMVVSGATTAPGTPSANPWAGAFRVVTSPYMQDATLTGNSATAWYLIADPNDLPLIEVAFLNNVQTPTVESTDADFAMLGQAWRGYYDIGVAIQEYRAGAKSAGA